MAVNISGAPTSKTPGKIGDHLVDSTTGKVYECISVNTYGGHDAVTFKQKKTEYVWKCIGDDPNYGSAPYQQLVTDGEGNTKWEDRLAYEVSVTSDIAGLEYAIDGFKSTVRTVEYDDEIPLELGQVWNVNALSADQILSSYDELEVRQSEDGTLYIGDIDLGEYPFSVTKNKAELNRNFQSNMDLSGLKLTCVSGTHTTTTTKQIDQKFLPVMDSVQADWNQNDDTQPDYVKNRPFYTGDPVETVVVEESTVTFIENNGLYEAEFRSTFEATVGDTYKVSFDGTVYECTCVDLDGITVIGNLSIVGAGSDTGEPFIIAIINGEPMQILTADTSTSHTVSISEMVAPVVTIDPKYLPASFKPAGKSYLTFSSLSSFTLKGYFGTKTWDGTIECFASDKTWTVWDGTTTLSAVADDGEYVLYLRGTGNTVITGNDERCRWVLTGTDIKCIGNIENLLDYAVVASGEHPTMANACYAYMFKDCTSLTQAPTLPATTLASSCYSFMFNGCGSLKLSSTKTDEYTQEYRIPSSGEGVTATNALLDMFKSTGGTFKGTPGINTTYYLSSDNMIVRETEVATLNGYVRSMIDAAIEEYADTAEYIIPSSTSGSTKKFKISVDDTGTISATEVT